MSGGRIEAEAGRQLERLFGAGAVGGLSDAELLERFAVADEEAAGAAFEAIVARHGPMVLRVCRRILRDTHAAEDAFQATFLVLARRARALGERELLGNWLYGVALRTSRKARLAAARRAARDRVAAGRRSETIVDPAPDERGDFERARILHDEIGRLPGSYRAAVVACYLEGLTQAEAARRLRLAESTVRGRLARARKLLGHRLTRRGVAPAVGLMTSETAAEAGSVLSAISTAGRLPEAIVRNVALDALHFARSAGPAPSGAVSSTARALADGVLSTMWLPSLKNVAIAAALAVGLGLTAGAAGVLGRPAAEVSPAPTPARAPVPAPAPSTDPRPEAEPASPLPQESGERRSKSSGGARKPGQSPAVDPDLARRAPGPIIRALPVSKDSTILSYLPETNLGHVDNFALQNVGGGVRVLIDWPALLADEVAAPDRRFVLALYSKKTTSNPPAGRIHAFEVLHDWPEIISWSRRPQYDPEPFATYAFEPGDGWKLFDVTALMRDQAKERRKGHGILLRFLSEDSNDSNSSGYDLVSREGAGEWAGRRPVLLVVKDTKTEKAQAK
jgi:RNA polymerase sigma factor (sigma-70 family)